MRFRSSDQRQVRQPDDEIQIWLNESKQYMFSFEDYLARANVQMVDITAETDDSAVTLSGQSANNGVLSYYAQGYEVGEALIVIKMTTTDSNRCPIGTVRFLVSDPATI